MNKLNRLFLLMMIAFSEGASAEECVVLLHGLARGASSMEALEERLLNEGYRVCNVDYPSRHFPVEQLAVMAVEKGLGCCRKRNSEKINFVTHSLGGILVRQYLKSNKLYDMGRAVMLGPPNKGSEVVDSLKDAHGFEGINGPAGRQLGTGPSNLPRALGPVEFELGVIAGTQSINLFLSTMLPDPDDGKVSVESTKVEGMTDFVALPTTHPFMMKNEKVIDQTVYFLKHGKFNIPTAQVPLAPDYSPSFPLP